MALQSKSRYYKPIGEWCRSQKDAGEECLWASIVFKVQGKVFAICSFEKPLTITLKPQRENLDAYLYHPAIEIARYVGRYGWVTITVEDKDTGRLALDLVQESYGVVSRKKRR